MTAYKTVIFDYGNVLCNPPVDDDTKNMAEVIEVPETEFERAYWKYRLDYDCGITSKEDYWGQVAKDLDSPLSEKKVSELVTLDVLSWSRPNSEVVEFAHQLNRLNVELALLSNMPLELRTWVESKCDWLPEFNHRTYSCEVKTAKPDPEIYKHSIYGIRNTASDAVFIDDREENIEAAKLHGVNAIHFKSFEDIRHIIR